MAPVLSPKKSIEGAVGGVLGAALLGAIYAAATGAYNPNPAHTPLIYAIICGVGALVSMVGFCDQETGKYQRLWNLDPRSWRYSGSV